MPTVIAAGNAGGRAMVTTSSALIRPSRKVMPLLICGKGVEGISWRLENFGYFRRDGVDATSNSHDGEDRNKLVAVLVKFEVCWRWIHDAAH